MAFFGSITGGGGGGGTSNQFAMFFEKLGPSSYATGGFVIDLSTTYSSLNSLKLIPKKGSRGVLPAGRLGYLLNTPSAGQVTVKVFKSQFDQITAVGNVANQPSGVTIQAASGVATSSDQTTVSADTFTRADSSTTLGTSSGGQTWTAQSGTWGIQTNRGYLVSTADGVYQATVSGVSHGIYSIDVVTTGTADRVQLGIMLRWVDSNNYILILMADVSGADRQVLIYKADAGVFTSLAASATAQWTPGNTVSLKAEFTGNLIVAYVGGVEVARYAMTAAEVTKYNSATNIGLWEFLGSAVDNGASRFDNLSLLNTHYHAIDHDHVSTTSSAATNTGAAVNANLAALNQNVGSHTHAVDPPNLVASSGIGSAHTHVNNNVYEHTHTNTLTDTNFSTIELPNATDISATTFLAMATGVRV